MKKLSSSVVATGVCCVLFGFSAFAVERIWTGGGGDSLWTTAANWGGTVPTGSDTAVFDIGSGVSLQVLDSAAVTYPGRISVKSGTVCLGSAGRYCSFSTLTGTVDVASDACLVMSNRIEKKNQAIVKMGAGKTVFTRHVCGDGGGTGCPFFDVQAGTVEFSGNNGYLKMHTTREGYIRIRNGAVFSIPGYNRTSGNVNFIIDDGGMFIAGNSSGNEIKTIEMNGGMVGGNTVDASAATYRAVANARSGIYFRKANGTPVAQRGGTLYLAKPPMQYNLLGGILAPTISLVSNTGATTENPCVFLLDGGLFAPSLNGGSIDSIFNASHLDKIVVKVGSDGARFGSINQENGANLYVGLNIPLAAETENADGGVTVEGRAIYRISKPFGLTGDVRVIGGGVALVNSADTATTPQFFGAGSFALRNSALTYQQCSSDKELELATASGKTVVYSGASLFRFRRASGGNSAGDYANNADDFSRQTLVSGPLSRAGKGAVLFVWDGVNQYVGETGASKCTVVGGVANGVSGAVAQPVIGIKNEDLTFLSYDSTDGFKPFSGYAAIGDATTSSSIVDLTDSSSSLASSKTIGGLRMMESKTLTISSGTTLSVGDGINPALVMIRKWSYIFGPGTLDFGTSEGIFAVGPHAADSQAPEVRAKISGSGGVSYVSAPDTDKFYRYITVLGANDYTGGTYVNSVRVLAKNASAFGSGDVHVGGGRIFGGRIAFDTAITVANDFHIAGTGIRDTMWDGFQKQGALEFDADATISGDVEITEPARITMPTANVTATISGTVSGDALEVLRSATSTLVLSGHNTYTGGTEVVSTTLALAHGDGAGTGSVRLDNATLRFVNETDIVFTNKVEGVGTIMLAGKGSVTFTDDCFAGLPDRKVLRRSSFPFPNVADGDFKELTGWLLIVE